ncbi:MAG: hypothetical protein MUE65_00950 [Methanomassiliicoccales archaeon]|nr:hypothetical protein [Methanomassiliicoccales archaeon]
MAILFCPRCRSLMQLRKDRMVCPKCGVVSGGAQKDGARAKVEPDGGRGASRSTAKGRIAPKYFPYEPRRNQLEMMSLVFRTMMSGGSAVIESGTGSGKTVCALAGALEYCIPNEMKLIYVTRTNSQSRQVMLELREIDRMAPVRGLAFQGRAHGCMLLRHHLLEDVDSGDLARSCEQRKKRSMTGQGDGCTFFENYMRDDLEEYRQFCLRSLPTAEEFMAFCEDRGACAYEAMKDRTAEAQVIVTSYPYVVSPDVRDTFFEMLGLEPAQCAIIVDEAHNLIDFAREAESLEMTTELVAAVQKEARAFGNAKLAQGVRMEDLCAALEDSIASLSKVAGEDQRKEAGLEPEELEGQLSSKLGLEKDELSDLGQRLMAQGEAIVQARTKRDEAPRSAALALGEALFRWTTAPPSRYRKYARDSLPPSLNAYCLDPAGALRIFQECHASVHMSGTLRPLQQYADLAGLADASQMAYDSPFPKENRLILYADDVTTEYTARGDESNMRRLKSHIVSLVRSTRRRTLVLFPSYALMRRLCEKGLEEELMVPVFKEEQGMPQDRLMRMVEQFKSGRVKGVLMATAQGRVAEGLDFPEEDLEMVIVVGIPYPPPSVPQKALEAYCARRFGEQRGREYASVVPAYRKMAQAIGRLIRTERDVGAAVILDKRARFFAKYMEMRASSAPVEEVQLFFRGRGRS